MSTDRIAYELERLRQDRLTWGMACDCDCQACQVLDRAIRELLAAASPDRDGG